MVDDNVQVAVRVSIVSIFCVFYRFLCAASGYIDSMYYVLLSDMVY